MTHAGSSKAVRQEWVAAGLWVALLWWWTIPSAYLWYIAERRDAILPYLPQWVWGLPGELWRTAPIIFVALISGLTYVIVVFLKGRRLRRGLTIIGGIWALLVTVIHLVWGNALLAL